MDTSHTSSYEQAILTSACDEDYVSSGGEHTNHDKTSFAHHKNSSRDNDMSAQVKSSCVVSSGVDLSSLREGSPAWKSKPAVTYLDVQSQAGVDTPAIIIHSALSTPGDDPEKLDKNFSPFSQVSNENNTQTDQADLAESDSVLSGVNQDINSPNGSAQSSTNMNEVSSNFQSSGNQSKSTKKTHRRNSDHSERYSGRGTQNSIRTVVSPDGRTIGEVHIDIQKDLFKGRHRPVDWDENSTASEPLLSKVSQGEFTPVDFRPRNSSMSNPAPRKIASTAGSTPSIHSTSSREFRSGPSTSSTTNTAKRLMPTVHKISKSYNDLSSKHMAHCGHGKAHLQSDRSPTSSRESKGRHHHRNSSCSNTSDRSDVHIHHHSHRHHLLPETKTFQGGRGMRSRSENDVRIRSGTDEYVWKDGTVQLKNGGLTHGESVRYVWKDGHVEKITTDANNEETQVEILETADNKTCNKINPMFVCIFLIGVIAVVIIVPVYYMT